MIIYILLSINNKAIYIYKYEKIILIIIHHIIYYKKDLLIEI